LSEAIGKIKTKKGTERKEKRALKKNTSKTNFGKGKIHS